MANPRQVRRAPAPSFNFEQLAVSLEALRLRAQQQKEKLLATLRRIERLEREVEHQLRNR